MDGVMLAVERSIASELPARFGIMLDGWTHASEHYVAVFACYKVNNCAKTTLLSMTPLLDSLEDDLSAQRHLDFLATMLPRDYGVQLGQCRFLVDDKCAVNQRLATLIEVLLVGCASHRLNFAVQADMAAVQALMVKLRTLKDKKFVYIWCGINCKISFEDKLRPVIRQDTRWSLTFSMVDRYLCLLEFLDVEDDDVLDLLPSPAVNKRLRLLLQEIRDIKSVTKALQGSDVDLLDVREWFDDLITAKPQ
ncbi:hypothetical protein PHMEG_00040587, partial [Phytophthora megakarya]